MRKSPRLEEREEARRMAHERTRVRISQIRSKSLASKTSCASPTAPGSQSDIEPEKPQPVITSASTQTHHAAAQSGVSQIPLYNRGQLAPLWCQPWLHEAVDAVLQTAANQEVRLVLMWPGHADALALVHALATLERNAIGDKQGLRALLYPTTRFSFSPLTHLLVDREKLLEWARHYLTVAAGVQPPLSGRDNQNKDMMLMALQSARNAAPASESPMLSEVLPHFDWDRVAKTWGHYGEKYLRRSRLALERSHKRALFEKVEDGRITRLGSPEAAPDALFGISHLATPRERRDAIKSKGLRGDTRQPEIVLFDLTRAMQMRAERPLIRSVPDIIKELAETWKAPYGVMIYTDDPKAFFSVRRLLTEKPRGKPLQIQTLVTAPKGNGLFESPLPRDWHPGQVSLRYFRISILDQEAAEVALKFWSLSEKMEPHSEASTECRKTAAYLLRLANLPGGYRDFTSWMMSQSFTDGLRQDMSWSACEYRLNGLLERGALGTHVDDVRQAITKATRLVDTYAEATPLALRLAKEVGACSEKIKTSVVVLFRFSADIAVAQSFLSRYAHYPGSRSFTEFSNRVSLRNQRELAQIVDSKILPSKFVFVGLPDETLRFLVSGDDIPADSVVIVDYRRANDVLIGLRALRSIDTYKAYRARISGIAGEIEKRLNELPKAIDLDRLERIQVPRLSLSTAATEHSRATELASSWRVELEGGRCISVSQRVYVYDPDDAGLFHNEQAENLKPGDLLFVMSDALKDLLETCLIAAGRSVMRGASLAEMVREYHRQILRNAKRLFGELEGVSLARRIQTRMLELSTIPKAVSLNRIRYWMDVEDSAAADSADLKPHSTRQKADFVVFARALEVPDNLIEHYWMMITGQRIALQEAGRELADRYARVLFSDESAEAHYQLGRETILMLQREAVQNTFRVVRTIPPSRDTRADS
jgi:hypothetical protein